MSVDGPWAIAICRMEEEIHAPIMKKNQYLSTVARVAGIGLLTATASLYAQGPAKGDVAKGKDIFDEKCGLCHESASTDKKMGPGLKGLYKRPKLSTTGKATSDATVFDKITVGGNGMPPFSDFSAGDKANLLAYLKSL